MALRCLTSVKGQHARQWLRSEVELVLNTISAIVCLLHIQHGPARQPSRYPIAELQP